MTTQISGGVKVENGDFVAGNKVIHNFYRSTDYQALQANLEKALQRVKKYPDEPEFWQELETAQQQIEDFKRDVLKLAEDFNKIPINTERLRLAKQYFEEGKYHDARTILDAEFMLQDQNALLAKKQRLNTELAEVSNQLEDNANEWLLKARLTAIDYSLSDRIAQTCHCFELALKSARTPENILEYAYFLQENNQYQTAEALYNEALEIHRKINSDTSFFCVVITLNNLGNLAAKNSHRHQDAEDLYNEALELLQTTPGGGIFLPEFLPEVAMTLNNLGALVVQNSRRHQEAENLYSKALRIYRELDQDNPQMFLPHVAMTLNNLGSLAKDNHRSQAAEDLYNEALDIYRQLAKNKPQMFLPYVATTLNNLGALVAQNSQRHQEAESFYNQALEIRRKLAQTNPETFLHNVAILHDVAMTLDNLGVLISKDDQRRIKAKQLYNEALEIRRDLAKANPQVFLPYVAITLTNLGKLMGQNKNRRIKTVQLYSEALEIRKKLVQVNPEVYLPDMVNTLATFGVVYLSWGETETALVYLQKAVDLFEPFAKKWPHVFGDKYEYILDIIAQIKSS